MECTEIVLDQETLMRCVICKHGETQMGTTTVTLERGETVVIFKKVPAAICDNCGEYYLSEEISQQLFDQAEEAVRKGSEVEIRRYAA